MTIQIPPELSETQARVYESYVKWYMNYFSPNKALRDAKKDKLDRHMKVARSFNDELRKQIGLEPLVEND